MVKINDNIVWWIGGIYNKSKGINYKDSTDKTWIADLTDGNFNMIEGPSLMKKRRDLSCGKILDSYGNVLLIAAGGLSYPTMEYMDSVEILNITAGNWIIGLLVNFEL